MIKKPLMLAILDGFALRENAQYNAIKAAKTPNLSRLMEKFPNTVLACSGKSVGLPDGQMGNSEVGHTNIGAGRVVYQELTRITKEIEEGCFFENKALLGAVSNCKKNNSALHIMGLLSDGGVHSHIEHLFALLKLAKINGLTKVFVHCFLDGRDTPPSSGADYVKRLQDEIDRINTGRIATVMGRYYAMDRDSRWERIERAYAALVYGEGEICDNAVNSVKASYDKGITDEFMLPAVISGAEGISANDSVIFYNFRPDRAREITRSLADKDFSAFSRKKGFFPLYYVCMTQYDATIEGVHIAFLPQSLKNTFGEYISKKGLTQLRIAETEKYAHVTFFFNGGVENVYSGEERCLIPSPKVATYDMQPEMSALLVTDEVEKRILSGKYDVIILNYANCDMVGHTGVWNAAVSAVETVDSCIGRVYEKIKKAGGTLIITADHGNSDRMMEEDGITPFTAHTTNPVPFIVCSDEVKKLKKGRLCDIAPTMLELLRLPIPGEMTGESLIEK
jgi:2,3-bisphosphoglycerate-independent phosphoglycerate mutase